jgi:large subunit ribosomal protein L18
MRRQSVIYKVPHRRRREGKTDYRQRLRLLRGKKDRLVVRMSNNMTICQVVRYGSKGDTVLTSADSNQVKKAGWKGHTGNLPAAYLVGYLCGLKAKKQKASECLFDAGLSSTGAGTRLFACLKGALDAGMSIPHSEDVIPKKERISGKHIEQYAASLKKDNPEQYKKQFSTLLKNKLEPETLSKHFEEVKNKLKA